MVKKTSKLYQGEIIQRILEYPGVTIFRRLFCVKFKIRRRSLAKLFHFFF